MTTKYKEVGGGGATGLSEDLISLLSSGLGGRFQPRGSAAMGDTMGIAGILNDILAGGAGKLGGSLGEMIHRDTETQSANLRARFGASGGQAFGTPAAYAESLFRSEAAPRAALGIGGLQLQTLLPLLQMTGMLSERGIAPRQTVAEPNPVVSALSSLGQGAASIAPFFSNPFSGMMQPQNLQSFIPDTSYFDPSQLYNIPMNIPGLR
jgi:hypothetical protein